MNDEDLKKKLSALKSASVPKGYWKGYWPRLQARLRSAERRAGGPAEDSVPWVPNRWMVPAFASLLIGITGYWLGSQRTLILRSSEPIVLASATGETQAQHVFRQMLELFPKRVNWISFQDGKVDFSISSTAYPESQTLIPLIVTLPRAKDPFEARLLIRAGQTARVQGAWEKKIVASIQVQVTADGRKALVNCRLNGSGLETEVDISKEDTQPLGSFRSGERLVQAQLTRPSEHSREKNHADGF